VCMMCTTAIRRNWSASQPPLCTKGRLAQLYGLLPPCPEGLALVPWRYLTAAAPVAGVIFPALTRLFIAASVSISNFQLVV